MKAVSFIFFLFYLSGNVFGQDPSTLVPSYDHISSKDLSTITPEFLLSCFCLEVNTEDIRIALDTDAENNLYILTFGRGVD
ncbi:MAG TPA: hypothetical protein VJ973_11650, partial [Christiangramia sp.]|nr:hypothetical protein [Christiangramia sp.]